MELHKNISFNNKYKLSLKDNYLDFFEKAKLFTIENYSEDFNRIKNTEFDEVTPDFFLREMTWCICVSGFNAKIVSNFFPDLLRILEPSFNLKNNYSIDLDSLLKIFNNKRKMNAIISNTNIIANGIKNMGWMLYRNSRLNHPEKLENFAMIGPAISKHLARNIGLLNFVKPDVHLKRLANIWNFNTPDDLCAAIQQKHHMPLGLIDLCLFYAASTFGTNENSSIR